ncbi:alpha/beta fold hydrolase [Alkalicoccus chagannorensis]|uniref:alpha/beta fold hydrolase n=1 Tax=Alkalicoccus chagannorensis TaxID=427072 RepID=UPI0004281465|nr:alpha/beta fold hydrolase [Alkalicoccus chagannorensis]
MTTSMVLIHGAGGSSAKFRRLLPLLEQEAHAVDLPGRAGHEPLPQTTIEAYAAWLAPQLPDQVDLAGHSMGGLIALETAARSSRVRSVTLIASHTSLPVHPSVLSRLEQGEYPDGLFYASYSRDQPDTAMLEEEKQAIQQMRPEQVHADFAACDMYQEGSAALASLQIPVHAIYGREDRLLPPEAVGTLQDVPHVTQTSLEGGHDVMLEQPDALAAVLNRMTMTSGRNKQ